MLRGKFPERLLPQSKHPINFTDIGHFLQGEETGKNLLIEDRMPEGLPRDDYRFYHRQVWLVDKYVPPMTVEEIDKVVEIKGRRFGILPKTDRAIEKEWVSTNTPKTYKGKKGKPNWIQFDYCMHIIHKYDLRRNIVAMVIVVPPDISSQIEEQVAKNVYFPDAFFKALYPGYIGPDIETDIKRKQATELEIVDLRKGKYNKEVRPYPQPL